MGQWSAADHRAPLLVAVCDCIVRGDLELDLKRFSATWKGSRVELTLTEFWIVHSLARHPGHVKSRDQLMDRLPKIHGDSR